MGDCRDLISFVKDRRGHDRRYAIDMSKIKKELDFRPKHSFRGGLEETADWYIAREDWWRPLQSGELRS
jgi:dTDP-glucose 4,6-dehydratase